MEIQLESQEPHTIQSYSHNSISVFGKTYQQSIIASKQALYLPWPVQDIASLTMADLDPLLQYQPEIIIIGHSSNQRPSLSITSQLSSQRIGLESMTIGAACRTFNVLLSEQRAVVLGVILPDTVIS